MTKIWTPELLKALEDWWDAGGSPYPDEAFRHGYRACEEKNSAAWQPIKTAPKDGTKILGFGDGGCIASTRYYAPSSRTQMWLNGVNDGPWEPTHWMPIPAPPTLGGASHD